MAETLEQEVVRLRAQVAELQSRNGDVAARPRIAKMSAEVVDSNPYRRVAAGKPTS